MTASKFIVQLFLIILWPTIYAQSQTYIVGGDFDYPPITFIDESGNARGFDIDVLNAISAETGI